MFDIQLGKEVIKQENSILSGRLFYEIHQKKLESYEDGFIFSTRKIGMGRYPLSDSVLKVIQMRSDVGMSRDDVPFSIGTEILQHYGFYVLKIDFRNIFECECIFSLKQHFYIRGMRLYKFYKIFAVFIVRLGTLDKQGIPKIQSIS